VEREHGVDRLRALAILCIVAIHCQTLFVIGRTDLMGRLSEWAVPGFFFVGGYVRARTTPYSPGTTRRWLVRLLPAYLIASLLALLLRSSVFGEPLALAKVLLALLAGSAWGIYYFVPVFLGVLICSHALARWPRSVPWVCAVSTACLVVTRWDVELDPFWRVAGFAGILRSPLFWWGYFFVGWIVKQRLERAQCRSRIFVLSSIAALICLLVILGEARPLETALARVGASIAVPMSVLFWSTRRLGCVMALLGEYSYEVYLFHYFAVAVASHWGFLSKGMAMPLALWAVALTTGLAMGILTRRALQGPLRAIVNT